MRYLSTRGLGSPLDFESVVLAGLAPDGGLYLPESLPHFSPQQLAGWRGLSYRELALEVMHPFMGDAISRSDLKPIVDASYAGFRHQAVVPLKQLGTNEWLMELFHGPTLAFKDVALQFLGRLVDYFLIRRDTSVVVLGATSGDTGSAAIAGCRGRKRMQSFILFPDGRVSDVQRRQMTTVPDANVHCIAVDGAFDDCQDIVKSLFADEGFRTAHRLVAVNSINWARILAQVVYYVYAALRLGAPATPVSFSVPTGNFGDIYAGYIARQIGVPIHRLIIATNRNDILTRCVATGTYAMEGVVPTLSPSMDIQISSNFERLLFDLYDRDGAQLGELMTQFRSTRSLTLSPAAHHGLKRLFDAARVSDDETRAAIRTLYDTTGELLDPHSAIGVAAGRAVHTDRSVPLVCLATAHPAKFPDAVKSASGIHPALPPLLADLFDLPERFEKLPATAEAIATFVAERRQ